MDHQFQVRQVNAPRRNIRGNADTRAPIAQGLQCIGAFGLGQLSRQGHDGKATVGELGCQSCHGGPRVAEHNRVLRLIIAQHVDDGVFSVAGMNIHRAVLNVSVLLGLTHCGDPLRVTLIGLRKLGNGGWYCCRKE